MQIYQQMKKQILLHCGLTIKKAEQACKHNFLLMYVSFFNFQVSTYTDRTEKQYEHRGNFHCLKKKADVSEDTYADTTHPWQTDLMFKFWNIPFRNWAVWSEMSWNLHGKQNKKTEWKQNSQVSHFRRNLFGLQSLHCRWWKEWTWSTFSIKRTQMSKVKRIVSCSKTLLLHKHDLAPLQYIKVTI